MHIYFNAGLFFVLLAASGLMMSVIWGTRNWGGGNSKQEFQPSDPEQDLLNKIRKLEHECNEMQGVLLEYNTNDTRQIYWDLLQEKTQAEVEYEKKYSHSRKVISFTRI